MSFTCNIRKEYIIYEDFLKLQIGKYLYNANI